jgi:spore germination cell wall hydrolase CwlJ-like protein
MDGPTGRASAKVSDRLPPELRKAPPPAPEPLRFRDVAPQDAVAINASVPIAEPATPAARSFKFVPAGLSDRERAIHCLTQAIYYESATEPVDGQRAVAQVVLNRVRHPAYPNTVCGVVYQGSERATGCQFTFTCDGALARTPIPSIWKRTQALAEAALAGYVYEPVGWATHYHTNWVVPYWSSQPPQGRERRHAYLLSLDRRLGHRPRLPQPLCGRRADRPDAQAHHADQKALSPPMLR